MSSFAVIAHVGGAFLFSDRALWNADETLHGVRTKIHAAQKVPLAVTTKGCMVKGAEVATLLCDRADRIGAAATIESLQDFATCVGEQLGEDDSVAGLKVCVAAWTPDRGGLYSAFQSSERMQNVTREGGTTEVAVKPYVVSEPKPGLHWSGGRFHAADIAKMGLNRLPSESEFDWYVRLGGGIMEAMRYRMGGGNDGLASVVGGGVDVVALNREGAKIARLIDWSDPVGLPVDPFRGMSGAERRRIERWVA